MVVETNQNRLQIVQEDIVAQLRSVLHMVDNELVKRGVHINMFRERPQVFWCIANEILLQDELELLREAIVLKAEEE